ALAGQAGRVRAVCLAARAVGRGCAATAHSQEPRGCRSEASSGLGAGAGEAGGAVDADLVGVGASRHIHLAVRPRLGLPVVTAPLGGDGGAVGHDGLRGLRVAPVVAGGRGLAAAGAALREAGQGAHRGRAGRHEAAAAQRPHAAPRQGHHVHHGRQDGVGDDLGHGCILLLQRSQADAGAAGRGQRLQLPVDGGDADGIARHLPPVQQGLHCLAVPAALGVSLGSMAVPESWEQGEMTSA
ncbi:hypothetical protein Nmel_017579, partial [Mimus melanotis]